MNPMPGSCTSPRVRISLSSWRIWSPTRSGLYPCATGIQNAKFKMQTMHAAGESAFTFCILNFELRRSDLHSLHREHFNDIAHLDVVEALEADAAFKAGFDLADVVFEAAQRGNLPFEDDHVVAQKPGRGFARPRDPSLRDHAAGNRPDFRHAEHLAHFGGPNAHFLERRLEETLHALLDLLGDVVNHRVQPDVHLFALGHVGRVAIGPDIEADDDGIRCGGEQYIRLCDRADTGADDSDLHLLV